MNELIAEKEKLENNILTLIKEFNNRSDMKVDFISWTYTMTKVKSTVLLK